MSALPPDGTHTLAIGEHEGNVRLLFERPVAYVDLDPETARQAAEQLARSAYKVRFGDTPTTQHRSAITDQKVTTLRIRVRNMLKQQFAGAEEAQFAIAANAILDVVLAEVA